MKNLAAVVLALGVVGPVAAHPGSGIVADPKGQIYFVDTGAGVWKMEPGGTLSRAPGPAFHWMAIDPGNSFAKTPLPSGSGFEVARAGESPTLIVSSDFPVTIGKDRNLYYPASVGRNSVEIRKVSAAGATTVLAKLSVPWVNGLAFGPDGSVYVSEDRAIRKIDRTGRTSTVISAVTVEGCASIPGNETEDGPYLRGLDVGADGSVVVAAAGCGSVLKVAPDGKLKKLVQVESPWSPTAVAYSGGDIYVQEYLHAPGEDRKVWIPRVRKISSDGKSAVIATVKRP